MRETITVQPMFLRVAAKDCAVASGTRISTLVTSEGDAALRDRTWNVTEEFGNGWLGPVYDSTGGPHGRPCFDFDTNAGIKNFIGFDTPPLTSTFTYYMVAKVRSFNPSSVPTNFLLTGGAGDMLAIRPSLVNGTKRLTISSPSFVTNLPVDKLFENGMFSTLIITVNGKDSKIKIGDNPIITMELSSFVYRGMIVGRWYLARSSGPGFDGAISEWGMYARALSEDEIDELFAALSRDALQ